MVVLLFHYHARRIDGFIHLVNLSLQPSDLIFVDMSLLVIYTTTKLTFLFYYAVMI